jgi:heme exporter protein A
MRWSEDARSRSCAIWSRAELSCVSTPLSSSPNGGLRIEYSEIEKRYGMRLALRGVSLSIAAGECVALVGQNGSGKTTLLKITAQLTRPSRGKLLFYSRDAQIPVDEIKSKVGMVGHHTLLYDELTAEENLTFFARLSGLSDPAERAARALEPAGLAGRAGDVVRTFSRGMRQRLSIARSLLASPALLLLDEPGNGLDPEGQRWLATTIMNLRDAGCTIMMSTHGRNETQSAVTRAIRLEGGKVTHDSGAGGNPSEVLVLAAVRDAVGESDS